jgi:6-pyruvoyltetrahydropterin/6-carboxytetrahydropterin synthase
MKVSVFRRAHFNSAHRLNNPELSAEENTSLFGKCNNPNYHGHNYMLEVKVKGEIDPKTGYVIDAKILKEIIYEEVHNRFDHKNLNLDTEAFKHVNPTAENIAIEIWNLINKRLSNDLELTVRLHETENNYVEFDGK